MQPPNPEMRASDAEREQTASVLEEQFAEGRLTHEELQDRLQQAYAARTIGQLANLTADLPAPSKTPPPARRSNLEVQRMKRVRDRVLAYVILMLFLIAIWAVSGQHGSFWPIWPIVIGAFILVFDVLGVERPGRHRRRQWRDGRGLERSGNGGTDQDRLESDDRDS